MKKLLMIMLVVAIEAQAKARTPDAKQLIAKSMRYERLNYQQLLANEASFLPNSPLLQGMDWLGKITPQNIDHALVMTVSSSVRGWGAITASQELTFDALYTPLEEIGVYIEKIWRPIQLGFMVVDNDKELKQAYDEASSYLYWIRQEVMSDEVVFQKLRALKESETLTDEQRRAVEDILQGMHFVAGIKLSEEDWAAVSHIETTANSLENELLSAYNDAYTDASTKIEVLLTDKKDVAGVACLSFAAGSE